jgi:hypothetical protein
MKKILQLKITMEENNLNQKDLIREQITKIAHSVKIDLCGDSKERLVDTVTSMIKLAQGIDDCEVTISDQTLFFNFPFQSLPLLDLENINQVPVFHRKTINNMICVPRFVGV